MNVTSMVYIKNSGLVGESGDYQDYTIKHGEIHIKRTKNYCIDPTYIHGLPMFITTPRGVYALHKTLYIHLEGGDIVRLVSPEYHPDFYKSFVMIF